MNHLRKHLLIGLAVLGMGSATLAVQAQTAPEGRHGSAMTQEQRQARMAEHFAKRDAMLHDALKITPAQEAAFRSYVSAMHPKPMAGMTDRAGWADMPAPARAEKMIAMHKQMVAEMEARLPALNAFYAVLTPEQKKMFDQHAMRGKRGHWGGRGMHHGQGGMGMDAMHKDMAK